MRSEASAPQKEQEYASAGTEAQKQTKTHRYHDYGAVFTVLFLIMFGLMIIYSSSYYTAMLEGRAPGYYMKHQLTYALLGGGAMLVLSLIISRVGYHWLQGFVSYTAYGVSLILMGLVRWSSLGVSKNGQTRWLEIGGHSLQPAEIVKASLILLAATLLTRYQKQVDEVKFTVCYYVIMGLPTLLVLGGNLSSGLIIAGIVICMKLVVSRKKKRYLLLAALVFAGFFIAINFGHKLVDLHILKAYQMERIDVWLAPEEYASEGGYQVLQGLYAIGSGGLFGKGLGNSTQKLGFLPEAENDMIFAVICEELGIFGGICILALYAYLIYRMLAIAVNTKDSFGFLLVAGAALHLIIQVLLNVAVVTNTLPNTGVTLPFISFGGTALAILMLEMGVVLAVAGETKLNYL